VIHHGRVLVLAQAESPKPFRLSVEVGSLHSPMNTTSGRVLLGQMEDATRDEILGREKLWQQEKPAARAAFLKRLAAIRSRGYERADGERFVGALDIGVPVGSPHSSMKAALTIAMLKEKGGSSLEDMLPALQSCSDAIALQAGLKREGEAHEQDAPHSGSQVSTV
jgi:DNA-binding IclR family transcriptional regulator